MFTGLIEALGVLTRREEADGGFALTISAPFSSELVVGESVACSGVCLTVTSCDQDGFSADVMPETVAMTTLGEIPVGATVNLERAVRADSRLGGHIVQGHVDGVGRITARRPGQRWDEVDIEVDAALAPFIAYKGSIAVDGISLTVSATMPTGFTVSLIPETLSSTTLGSTPVGGRVNIETDVLARYVARAREFIVEEAHA